TDDAAAAEVARAADSSVARDRRAAATALAVSRRDDDVEPMLRLAHDSDGSVRRAALRGLAGFLGKSGIEVRARLEAVACDPSATRGERLEAIQSLAGGPAVVGQHPLDEVAQSDPDPVLRLAAARTVLAQSNVS